MLLMVLFSHFHLSKWVLSIIILCNIINVVNGNDIQCITVDCLQMVSEWWALMVLMLSAAYGHAPCQHSYGGCRYNEPFVPAPVGQVPRCVQNYHGDVTFCETIDRYPEQLISYLVTKSDKNFKSFFNEEKLVDRPYYQNQNTNNYHKGYGNYHDYQNDTQDEFVGYPDRTYVLPEVSLTESPIIDQNRHLTPNVNHGGVYKRRKRQDDVQLCQVKTNNIFPKAALNTQGEWKYVVNMVRTPSDMYTQSIRSEICAEPDQPCNGICDTPLGFSTSCKQKFVQKRLVALQGTGDNLYVDVFWFPHCCSCNIARVEQ
ncbi:unnamed protein product [Aphis gossypii]|uniref:Spaetzle domain-containing protein n=1 Tax=Aphis gossypii TaxID=80765 RepID=A0A9P0IKT8_APHGO|nr:unnamed protein product [Aphis gossypii]